MLAQGGSEGAMLDTSIIRLAKLLRLSRMARMARLLRAMPELLILIKGMLAACRSVFFTLCLLTLIMFVFSVAFRQLSVDCDFADIYFVSVPASMYSLLLHGTLLDDVSTMAKDIGKESA